MATKTELEAELAKLKQELAENKSAAKKEKAEQPEVQEDDQWEELEHGSLEGIAEKIVEELEELPMKKPLLLALGVFVLGYMIGRSR